MMHGYGKGYYRLVLAVLLLASCGCAGGALPMPLEEDPADAPVVAGDPLPPRVDEEPVDSCFGSSQPATTTHRAMLDALNLYRIENGLSPLVYSSVLEAAVEAHLQDMHQRGYFDHVSPEGDGPSARALAAGFCHRYVGENLAAGQPSVERVMQAWQDSPGHDANMVEPDYLYVGMGVYVAPNGRIYWGQAFALDVP